MYLVMEKENNTYKDGLIYKCGPVSLSLIQTGEDKLLMLVVN